MKYIALILVLSMMVIVTGCNNIIDTSSITESNVTSELANSSSPSDTSGSPETNPQSQEPNTEGTSDEGSTDTTPHTNVPSTDVGIDDPIKDSEVEQSHIGIWYIDTDKNISVRITRMKSDMVLFSAKPTGAVPRFTACAVKQGDEYIFGKNVSPEYSDRLVEYNLSGKLILDDYGVRLVYNPSYLWDTEIVQHFTIKNEVDIIDWPNMNLPTGISETLQGIIDKLDNAGWTDIEVIPHEPDVRNRWGGRYLEPYALSSNQILYCVTARAKRSYVNAYVIFENNKQVDEYIYYIHISGRTLDGSLLKDFLVEQNCDFIIPANNESLHNFFESY